MNPNDLQRPWVGRLSESRYAALACGENGAEAAANARLIAAAPTMLDVLNYVADMTCIQIDGEWTFKPDYDPQRVLDVIAQATGEPS